MFYDVSDEFSGSDGCRASRLNLRVYNVNVMNKKPSGSTHKQATLCKYPLLLWTSHSDRLFYSHDEHNKLLCFYASLATESRQVCNPTMTVIRFSGTSCLSLSLSGGLRSRGRVLLWKPLMIPLGMWLYSLSTCCPNMFTSPLLLCMFVDVLASVNHHGVRQGGLVKRLLFRQSHCSHPIQRR